jgi:peptidoglycan-associated lipoprotein
MKFMLLTLSLLAFWGCAPRRPIARATGGPNIKSDPGPAETRAPEKIPDAVTPSADIHEHDAAIAIKPRKSLQAVVTEVNDELKDAFFPYDRSEMTSDALNALSADAALLRPILAEFPAARIVVEGHCDERGSAEYNLALGDRRAARARAVLTQSGIPEERIDSTSYGKELPQCTEPAESCRCRNRRAHLRLREP